MVLLPVLSTILVLSIQSTSTATILKADDVEIIAGLVLYRVERGEIRYVLLQKADELDDWSVPKGKPVKKKAPYFQNTENWNPLLPSCFSLN